MWHEQIKQNPIEVRVPIVSPQSEATLSGIRIDTAGATEDPELYPTHLYKTMAKAAGGTASLRGGNHSRIVSPTSASTVSEEEEKENRKRKRKRRRNRRRKQQNIRAITGILWKDSSTDRGLEVKGFGVLKGARARKEKELEDIIAHLRKKGLRNNTLTPATAGNG